ncbi:MAG: tRNA (adenosine(37)-N6)-threonylcarbamoyltransferase complex ATPase subunit type 1 TsaE [Deltaproteobacteria bacterium]|jgi:tRNA threonylcarbamoyladenosine biosynthesis protein TsaE|nr:tRNA (adenosine(37)-N6)-threonylcarbamoyltransferase complex ATPase subunit type 1 TsaE [Deltaproteobacteria bacterium]
MLSLELSTIKRTEELGKILGKIVEPGDIITLQGPLGAGKTALTQAIGRGLGIDPRIYITSPTFSLLHEYKGRIPLYHMDLYRLSGEEEIVSLGFPEYFSGSGVTVIEWPERLGSHMPAERLEIELVISGEMSRIAKLAGHGSLWQKKVAEIVSMV